MPVSVSSVVRAILTNDINLPADAVVKKARTQGVTATDEAIRKSVYNIRGELKKGPKAGAKPVPAAARATPAPVPKALPEAAVPTPSSSASDLSAVLANVALVNTVMGLCGGAEPARKVAEAVKACGSVEAFLQHLDLVAGIRGGASA